MFSFICISIANVTSSFAFFILIPSSIYSQSVGHILEQEFHVWAICAVRVVRRKKVDLRNFEQLKRVVFSTFCGQKKFRILKNIFQHLIEKLHKMAFINYFLKCKKVEKIDYHSNLNFELSTESHCLKHWVLIYLPTQST